MTVERPADRNPQISSHWQVFSTCPTPRAGEAGASYRDRVARVGRWAETAGCAGMLVYTDNSLPDPWLVSQVLIDHTSSLCPLVAVQPVYLHPYAVAKMVSTIGLLTGRRLYLNMVAGGFTSDLRALSDVTPHDRRYDRLVEYTKSIQALLAGEGPATFLGEFYRLDRASLGSDFPVSLRPGVFVSGSSPAGMAAARALDATAIQYPGPPEQVEADRAANTSRGIRIGVIARADEDAAWEIAVRRFPPSREGQIKHKLAMKISDSHWHRQLSGQSDGEPDERPTYWLHPFQNYATFCPYLVGSYENVARELARYGRAGYCTVILDIPPDEEELEHIKEVFVRASGAMSALAPGAAS